MFIGLLILQVCLASLGFTQGGSRGTGVLDFTQGGYRGTGVIYSIGLSGRVDRSLGRRAMAGVWLGFGLLFDPLCLLDSGVCYRNKQ